MKKVHLLATIIGILSLTLSACTTINGMVADILPQTFRSPVKVYTGNAIAPGGKVLATDGSDFYSAFIFNPITDEPSSLRLARISKDVTVTGADYPLLTRAKEVLDGQLSIAVSDANVAQSQKIIHIIWSQSIDDPISNTSAGIYYAWCSSADLSKLSSPVKISGTISDFGALSLLAGKNGALHIVFRGSGDKIYYASAPAFKAPFTTPVQIASGVQYTDRNVDAVLDKDDNLHLAFVVSDTPGKVGVSYMSKRAASNGWSAPLIVAETAQASVTGFIAIAAVDSDTVYIANTVVDEKALDIFRSVDGGKTWDAKQLEGKPTKHISIAVASDKSVTVGTGVQKADNAEIMAVFRSKDGITWSELAIIPKVSSVNIVIDNNGKAGILCMGQPGPDENASLFAKER